MDRWLVRRWAAVVVGVIGVAGFGVAGVAAAEPTWTITYSPVDGPDALCTSEPDVAVLTVRPGTPITLVNRTGVAATVDTGTSSRNVDDGQAIMARFTDGAHQVRMVPNCLVSGQITAAMVYVVRDSPTEGPGPAGPTATRTPSAAPGSSVTSGVGQRGSNRATTPVTSTATGTSPRSTPRPSASPRPTAGGGPGPTSGPSSTALAAGADANPVLGGGPDQEEFSAPFRVAQTDHRGVHLVAVVALICILGVSVGIIRAIRAQRTTGAVGRVT